MQQSQATTKHLLFFVTEDWYFCSHRLPLAQAAIAAGYRVTVVTRVNKHGEQIRHSGIQLIPIAIRRRSLNPLRELILIIQLLMIYQRERPDIVHNIAMKPVLYGTIAAYIMGIAGIVNAIAGLGFLFTSQHFKARLLRPIVKIALRWLLSGNTQVILQNPDDLKLLREQIGVSASKLHLIYGAGVDLNVFKFTPIPNFIQTGTIIILPSRLLWDKGVGEFVAAASILHNWGLIARCVLVGIPDLNNPAAVPKAKIQAWIQANVIEWWGYHMNMPAVFEQCHIVCLPSYREGLPKALAEAAACGRPIVTTNTPGCKEVVQHGKNGLLVPIKDAMALAMALAELVRKPELQVVYGKASRELAETKFGSEKIIAATLAVYQACV